MLKIYVAISSVPWTDFRFYLYIVIPNKYFSSFINVPYFMRVTEIVEITPNVTEVVLLLLNGRDLRKTFNCTRETLSKTDVQRSDPYMLPFHSLAIQQMKLINHLRKVIFHWQGFQSLFIWSCNSLSHFPGETYYNFYSYIISVFLKQSNLFKHINTEVPYHSSSTAWPACRRPRTQWGGVWGGTPPSWPPCHGPPGRAWPQHRTSQTGQYCPALWSSPLFLLARETHSFFLVLQWLKGIYK